nr:IS3 family transposase [Thermobifida halotolerans]
MLRVAPSTYYAARPRPPSPRSRTDAATSEAVAKVHADNHGVYGVRKVHAELNRQGHRVLDTWLLPGGHLEAEGTDLLAASPRELAEETGLRPERVVPEGGNRRGPTRHRHPPLPRQPGRG